MSDIIQLLPDSVANQIAAGEVVQRPASALKELIENAIDSGADKIQVLIKDAGKSLIQVIDNGCGMSITDAREVVLSMSTTVGSCSPTPENPVSVPVTVTVTRQDTGVVVTSTTTYIFIAES